MIGASMFFLNQCFKAENIFTFLLVHCGASNICPESLYTGYNQFIRVRQSIEKDCRRTNEFFCLAVIPHNPQNGSPVMVEGFLRGSPAAMETFQKREREEGLALPKLTTECSHHFQRQPRWRNTVSSKVLRSRSQIWHIMFHYRKVTTLYDSKVTLSRW